MKGHGSETKFGEKIRHLRIEKKISLRRFAKMVDMSATYLSKVERDEFPPPGEEKVRAIARALDQDIDELLALAGRVASDLPEIIKGQPRGIAAFLRTAKGLSSHEIEHLRLEAQKIVGGKRVIDRPPVGRLRLPGYTN